MPQSLNLTGKLLVAMPGMPDPRFANAVILLCAHSADGAMGVMINRPNLKVSLSTLLDHLTIEDVAGCAEGIVHSGGPVEEERGFVLHSTEYHSEVSTLGVTSQIAMTATLDILEDLANGTGPCRSLIALGYCGWAAGQLEAEIAENGWLVGDSSPELVFGTDDQRKWHDSMIRQGIDPLALSSTFGRA